MVQRRVQVPALLFPARRFARSFRLALSRFFLFFQAGLLSALLVFRLVLPAFVLNDALVFCHAEIIRGEPLCSWEQVQSSRIIGTSKHPPPPRECLFRERPCRLRRGLFC